MKPAPVIPWMGGKRRLAKRILPILPAHTCYVEPFAGGAAIFFMKESSKVEVLNDIDGELVNLYRVIKFHLETFYSEFKHALISRQMFEWLNNTPPETLTDIQRAARFFYLQKMAFGGKTHGRTFGISKTSAPRLNFLRVEEDLSAAHLRLARTYIENLPWHQVITRYDGPETLFYCDPPYWGTAGYGHPFDWPEYEHMAALAKSIKGAMIISINDHPDIRELFSGSKFTEVDIRYTTGSGTGKAARELIIQP